MVSKYLEKKVEINQNEDIEKLNNPINLEYYLTEVNNLAMDETNVEKIFGIEIIKKASNAKTESQWVRDLSLCREYVLSLVGKFANNTVTPAGMNFILDDIIGV